MTSSAHECSICSNVYNEDHCPRILPCSHTFCGCCIDGIITTQANVCPVCRETFTANSAEDLVLNRGLLDAANQILLLNKDLLDATNQHSSMPAVSKTLPTGFRRPKRSFRDAIKDFRKENIEKTLTDCQEVESQILRALEIYKEMEKDVLHSNEEVDAFIERVQKIKDSNTKILTNIYENTGLLTNKLTIIRQEQDKIQDTNGKLDTAVDFASAGVIMDEAEGVLQDTQETVVEFSEHLQDNEMERHNSETEILKQNISLKNIGEEIAKRIVVFPRNVDMVNDLQRLSALLKENAQRPIFAMKIFKGKQRVAPVKKGPNNQFFVNHLEEGHLPPGCIAIEIKSLIERSGRRAFLDLAADGTYMGRMVIEVLDGSIKARNFLHMCAGDLGPSYVNSRAPGVCMERGDLVSVPFGEYETESGTSMEAVLSGVDWVKEDENFSMFSQDWYGGYGALRGFVSHEFASWFDVVIDIDNCQGRYWDGKKQFGKVVEGIGILRGAIQYHPNFKPIKIVNCGIIFSL